MKVITSQVIAVSEPTSDGDGMSDTITFSASRSIDAPIDVVWSIVSDLDAYASHVEGLAETVVIDGAAEGAQRRCTDTTGAAWEERCVLWEPGRRYVVDVDVSTYPWKFRSVFREFQGTWSVDPDADGTRVTIRFDATPRRVPGVRALVRRAQAGVEADLEQILESYARSARLLVD